MVILCFRNVCDFVDKLDGLSEIVELVVFFYCIIDQLPVLDLFEMFFCLFS